MERLAVVHDPTGAMFNIGPVTRQQDGSVVSMEILRRREERRAAKENKAYNTNDSTQSNKATEISTKTSIRNHSVDDDKIILMPVTQPDQNRSNRILSKTQQKKLAALEPRAPPPKPIIPDGVAIPEGEENWLALWDLPDSELERRVIRAKRRKAAARKALRLKQQSGKAERRAARDEKRKVYRDLKLTWKLIKGSFIQERSDTHTNYGTAEEKKHKTKVDNVEKQEAKKIAVEIADFDRKMALECCAVLGYTLKSTPGVDDIQPILLGMKGQKVDFDALEIDETTHEVKLKDPKKSTSGGRVDLSTFSKDVDAYIGPSGPRDGDGDAAGDFLKFEAGDDQHFEAISYNHKLRRKVRRALEQAQIKRELLVRERARAACIEMGIEVPPELSSIFKPVHVTGQRVLENGALETAKSERVRARLELAEFNRNAKALRKQAKDIAMESGLRIHAELTGRIPPGSRHTGKTYGAGWHVSKDNDPKDTHCTEDVAISAANSSDSER